MNGSPAEDGLAAGAIPEGYIPPGSADHEQVTGSRQAANRTRTASGPSVKLLLSPSSPLRVGLVPDSRFGPAGRARMLPAYDLGTPPPELPAGAVGRDVQRLALDDTVAFVLDRIEAVLTPARARVVRMGSNLQDFLRWLSQFNGDTWEERWLASGADAAPRSWQRAVKGDDSSLLRRMSMATNAMLITRVLRPSYGWLLESHAGVRLPEKVLRVNDATGFDQLRRLSAYQDALPRHRIDAETCLARVMIRTGRTLEQLNADQLLHYADVVRTSGRSRREHLAWELMVALGHFAGEPATLRAAWSAKGNSRQHSVATLVDRYDIPPSGVRDLLVDYLNEIKSGMDYSSLEGLAYRLVRLFWWEVLQLNPHQADLRLDPATVTAWRERLAVTCDTKPRREIHSVLFAIRALYRDLAEWAHEDPVRWGVWVAPCPVGRRESWNASKAKRHQKARTQARTRMLTPLLASLVAEAQRRKDWSARLRATAAAAGDGETFTVDGVTYQRSAPAPRSHADVQSNAWALLVCSDRDAALPSMENGRVNVTRIESDGFWAWAIVETLRHTGMRIEELLELTQLSLRHYTSASSNTLVPLLHIVPSKNDMERLIPMSPELVNVLLAVVRRAKGSNTQVPLSVRYDQLERTYGEPLPHLFARRVGTRHEVVSRFYVYRILRELSAAAGLSDAGQPVWFAPSRLPPLVHHRARQQRSTPAHRRQPARTPEP